MTTLIDGALLGLALGLRHTLEPDHLAAVGTFVSRARRPGQAAAMGALWGVGHAAAIIALGGLVLALRRAMPAWLDAGLELGVGAMLIALGGRTMWAARRLQLGQQPSPARLGPFGVGVGHGLAGTGAAVLLATAAMPDAVSGTGFLAVFGVGSVFGMAIVAGVVSLPLGRISSNARWCVRALRVTGLVSLAVGAWWLLLSGCALLSR
jgi:hypothetical protein